MFFKSLNWFLFAYTLLQKQHIALYSQHFILFQWATGTPVCSVLLPDGDNHS